MASDNSFDVVSKVELQEVKNAIDQATKEVNARFDLKNSKSKIELEGTRPSSSPPGRVQAQGRHRDPLAEAGQARRLAQEPRVREDRARRQLQRPPEDQAQAGHPTSEKAKKIVAAIKDSKKKAQASIQGDTVRVVSKDRDTCRRSWLLARQDIGVELQFTNFRSNSIDDDETDRDLVENTRKNFTQDKAKDGVDPRLFPLTSKIQADYLFHLVGQEHINGRGVFHIDFRPKDKDDFSWKGDAYIDTTSFQPVVVRTTMSRKVPFAVRTVLGTNVPGLGFNIVYAPQPDGVWFPVNFGTEFKLRVLFFFSRDITINAENRDFEKTHTDSKIVPTNR
jgi:uncharacterized protein YajQ (UPF0234 family)